MLDHPTGWNSTFLMLQRCLEQYPALIAATLDCRLKENPKLKMLQKVTNENLTNIESFCEVMGYFSTFMQAISSEKRRQQALYYR